MTTPRSSLLLTLLLLLGIQVPHRVTSSTIDICLWSGEKGHGSSYIANNNYPGAIPPQPHSCQCTIERHPDTTAHTMAVALTVKHANFTGSSCQQKLYVKFPGHSTQSSTVCSSSRRVTERTIFSRSSIQNGEIISVTFNKVAHIADNGQFVIEVHVTGRVIFVCTAGSRTFTANPPSKTTGATYEPFTPPYQHDFSRTLAEPRAGGLATGLGAGIAVGVAISVVTAILIFMIRRRRHSSGQDNPSHAAMEQPPPSDNNFTENDNISEIPAVYDAVYQRPRDQYEQLHGVTSSTPVKYGKVQGYNNEALNVPRGIDTSVPRDNIRRAAEPEADLTGYAALT